MNHIYRNVWNEITRTYVAAAEIVKGRGKKSKSAASVAEASEAGLAASGLRVSKTLSQAPPQRRKLRATLPRPFALEQRFMFDGAAMVDIVNEPMGYLDLTPTPVRNDREAHAASESADAAAPRAEPISSGSGIFVLTGERGSDAPQLLEAIRQAEQRLAEFLSQDDAVTRLHTLFGGSTAPAGEPTALWAERALSFLDAYGRGDASVRTELRSAADLQGALGAFAAQGPQGEPVIYLNEAKVANFSAEEITRLLLEEAGHWIDSQLNGTTDTPGDEGEGFALALTGRSLNLLSLSTGTSADAERPEQLLLVLDGVSVAVETATPPATWTIQATQSDYFFSSYSLYGIL